MYETDSEMTNMIEGKLISDSEQMTKSLLNMGMAWLSSIDFGKTDTKLARRLKEKAQLEDKWISQVWNTYVNECMSTVTMSIIISVWLDLWSASNKFAICINTIL